MGSPAAQLKDIKFSHLFTDNRMHKLISKLIASFKSEVALDEKVLYDAPDEQTYYMQFKKLDGWLLLIIEKSAGKKNLNPDLLSPYASPEQQQKNYNNIRQIWKRVCSRLSRN